MWRRVVPPSGFAATTYVFCDEKRTDFWNKKWDVLGPKQDPGWQRDIANPLITKFRDLWGLKPDSRVLVPLCGKTLDLGFLRQHAEKVTGVECNQRAILEAAEEQSFKWIIDGRIPLFEPASKFEGSRLGRVFKRGPQGLGYYFDSKTASGTNFTYENLTIIMEDVLEIELPRVTHIWDRASLHAINPDDREKYVEQMYNALVPGGKILLSVVTCDESKKSGPPHDISEAKVNSLFGPDKWIVEKLDVSDILYEDVHACPIKAGDRVPTTEEGYIITKRDDESSGSSSMKYIGFATGGGLFTAVALFGLYKYFGIKKD